MLKKDVVITGIGVLSPIGLDTETFWGALQEEKSGIGFVRSLGGADEQFPIGGTVPDFKPKDFVKPKKNIKVMSRDIQLGFVAAVHACNDAGLITEGDQRNVDPDRFGVVLGTDLIALELPELYDAFLPGINGSQYDFSTWGNAAMEHVFPLWMLKFLPNMPGCHIAIAHDARGPNNSLTLQRGSSLAALIEAARIIERGDADVIISGGCGQCVHPSFLARKKLHLTADSVADPTTIPRPFDRDRCGAVLSEGAGVFILESREFAESRGAKMYAGIRGFANSMSQRSLDDPESRTEGIRRVIRGALEDAEIQAGDLQHLNADGNGTDFEDRLESRAIAAELNDVPIVGLKGYFGNCGSGAGAVELVGSILALKNECVPRTRNCDVIAPDCPIPVTQKAEQSSRRFAMKMNNTIDGRSLALVVENLG